MAILFSDNFNRANGAIGANYADLGGTTNIVSNQVVCSTSPYSFFYWVGGPPPADSYIEVVAVNAPIDPNFTALMLRLDLGGGQNWYHFGWDDGGASIRRYDAAVGTTLGAAFSAPTTNQTVRFQVVGTTLSVFYDGVLQATRTDSTYSGTGDSGAGVWSQGGTIDGLVIGSLAEVEVTLGPTEGADTAAVAAEVEWLMILAAMEPQDTAAVVGQGEILLNLGSSEGPDTLASTFITEWALNLAATEAADTILINLSDANLVTLTATEAADTFAAGFDVEWTLIFETAEGPDTAAVSLLSEWLVSLAATESPDTAAVSGLLETLLTFSAVEGQDRAAIQLEIAGAGPIVSPAALWIRVNGVTIYARRERIREWGA